MSRERSERSPVRRALTRGAEVGDGQGMESMASLKLLTARSARGKPRKASGMQPEARAQKAPAQAKVAARDWKQARPESEVLAVRKRITRRKGTARQGEDAGSRPSATRVPAAIPARKKVHSPAKIPSLVIPKSFKHKF